MDEQNQSSFLEEVESPSIIVDYQILLKNIQLMSEKAAKHGVRLRPHAKTHKCVEIANLQLEYGAVGITVAKVEEAVQFLNHGFKSITIAYPIINKAKLEFILSSQTHHHAELRLVVDSEYGLDLMQSVAKTKNTKIHLFLKIDVGLGRVGVKPSDPRLLTLAKRISESEVLHFCGILSHAGQAYGAQNVEQINAIAVQEQEIMTKTKLLIENELGIKVEEVSVGSTPTVLASNNFEGITEIRPGNYVFMDRTQLSKGLIEHKDISLFVVSTVVSVNQEYIIIDAGSKVFSSDLAPHSSKGLEGYGEAYLINDWSSKQNKLFVVKLSEEHGWIKRDSNVDLQVGSRVCVIPNHSCSAANLSDYYEVMGKDESKSNIKWKVVARGCVR